MPAARRHVQSAQDNDDLASRADRLYVAAMSNHQKPVSPAPVRPIIIGRINFIGLRAFYYREVMRFVKIITQTVFAPILTAALFMAVLRLPSVNVSAPKGAGLHHLSGAGADYDAGPAKRLCQHLDIICCLKGAGQYR